MVLKQEFFGRQANLLYDGKHPVFNAETSDLRTFFRIEKTVRPEPNNIEIRIYNLSLTSRAKLEDKTKDVALEVGYSEEKLPDLEQIFVGNIRNITHEREGPDWVTRITAGDGERAVSQVVTGLSIGAGKPYANAIRQILDVFSAQGINTKTALAKILDAIFSGEVLSFLNGFSFDGNASQALGKLLKPLKLSHSIQDGELIVSKEPLCVPEGPSIEVSRRRGLIGSPTIAEQKEDKADKKVRSYVKFRVLLNPKIKPNSAIELRASDKKFQGVQLCAERVIHFGDTHGQDWYTEVEALAPEALAPEAVEAA